MAQRADGEILGRFLQDRELLPYRDADIARRMGMDRSNYSSYVNGHLPITKGFLRRFYGVFGEEIHVLQEKARLMKKERIQSSEYNELSKRMDALESTIKWILQEVIGIESRG
jgi:transcriptional regulator with XRE-family HTH domain